MLETYFSNSLALPVQLLQVLLRPPADLLVVSHCDALAVAAAKVQLVIGNAFGLVVNRPHPRCRSLRLTAPATAVAQVLLRLLLLAERALTGSAASPSHYHTFPSNRFMQVVIALAKDGLLRLEAFA